MQDVVMYCRLALVAKKIPPIRSVYLMGFKVRKVWIKGGGGGGRPQGGGLLHASAPQVFPMSPVSVKEFNRTNEGSPS